MEKSKVYFSDMRALPGTNLQEKLYNLIKAAGIADIDFGGKFSQRLFADGKGAELGKVSFGKIRMILEQIGADNQGQYRIAQKFHSFVTVQRGMLGSAFVCIGGMDHSVSQKGDILKFVPDLLLQLIESIVHSMRSRFIDSTAQRLLISPITL